MNKSMIWKIGASILAFMAVILCLFWVYHAQGADDMGAIRIIITDEKGQTIKDDQISYQEGDTLEQILKSHYDCLIENGMIMRLETLITPEDWSYFICIYHNGNMSNVGINELSFKDGDVISFVFTDAGTWND